MLLISNTDGRNESGQMRSKYDTTFKEEVLKMVQNGCPVLKITQSLGIGESLIYKWNSRNTPKPRLTPLD